MASLIALWIDEGYHDVASPFGHGQSLVEVR